MTPTIEDVASRIESLGIAIAREANEEEIRRRGRWYEGGSITEAYHVIGRGKEYSRIITAELAALVESRDALLRECVNELRRIRDQHDDVAALFMEYANKDKAVLLARIDAVLKGGA